MLPPSLTPYEQELLRRAAESSEYASLPDLDHDTLRDVTTRHGIDFATTLLYDRVVRAPANAEFIATVDALMDAPGKEPVLHDVTLVVVPGAFHAEYPHTGADGRMLHEVAEQAGCRIQTVPTRSIGTLTENALPILATLREAPGPIVLVSLSKGGADVKMALATPDAAHAFRDVVAWINICGLLSGTPLARWILKSWMRTSLFRILFALRGYDFQFVRDLDCGPATPLAGELRLPAHTRFVSVVGFPLERHLTNRLTRRNHRRLAPLGPNDAGGLLRDACAPPGVTYPVWGADHYLRPGWDMSRLATTIVRWVDGEGP